MIFVCDAYGQTKWYWDGDSYIRLTEEGEERGNLRPASLPDPWLLWKKRADRAGVNTTSPKGSKLRPQDSTFKLWDHAHANIHYPLSNSEAASQRPAG